MSVVKKTLMSAAGGQGEYFALYQDESVDAGYYWITDGGPIITYDQYAYFYTIPYGVSPLSAQGYYPTITKIDISGNIIWSYEYTDDYTSGDYDSPENHNMLISDDGNYLYFSIYEDSSHEHIVTKLDTSDGSVVWSHDVNGSFTNSQERATLFFDTDGDVILTSYVQFGNNVTDKGKVYFAKFNATNGARSGYNGNNSSYVTKPKDIVSYQGVKATHNLSPNLNSTVFGFGGRDTSVYSSRVYLNHTVFTGNNGANISSNGTQGIYTDTPYNSIDQQVAGITWVNGNQFLMWANQNNEFAANGSNSNMNTLSLFTTNTAGGNITYQGGKNPTNTGTAAGVPVQDSSGDWHCWSYNGNNGGVITKFSISGNTITSNEAIRFNLSGLRMTDVGQSLATDDYGGVWVSGRTGASDYSGFVMRLPITYSDVSTNSVSLSGTNTVNFTFPTPSNSAVSNPWSGGGTSNNWPGTQTLNNVTDGSNNRLLSRQNIRDPDGVLPYKANL